MFQVLIFAALISCDFGQKVKLMKWDKMLGALRYPMYLNHYLVGFFFYLALGTPFSNGTMKLFWISVIPLLLISFLMAWLIDRPIEHIRSRIKKGAGRGDRPAEE